MTTLVDQEARDRVTGGLQESLLVEAGAGTGKTTAIVQRIANLLATGTATVDDLAVVTFTKDAAAELVSRVRERLEEELATTGDEDRRARLAVALAGLYRACISTLHVFATTLLRERPVEARVDPGLRTTDNVERAQLMDAAYEAWLGEVLTRDDEDLRLALNRGLQLKHVRKLCELVDKHRAALPLAPTTLATIDHAGFRTTVATLAQTLAGLAPQCHDADDKGIVLYPGLVEFATAVAEAADDLALERVILDRRPPIAPGSGNQNNWSSADACRAYKADVGELKTAVEDITAALRGNALAGILPLAVSFVERFTDERRAAGVADFDDLLLLARDLLRSDAGARRWLRRRYPHVLIDEFQDTDPLQAEIALLLTSEGEDDDWRTLRPVDASLVVVGDPKQSIYRFRRADIATYDAVRTGPLDGRSVALRQNFRSVAGILSFSNDVFARVFKDATAGEQAPHVPLETNAPATADPRRAPVVMAFDPEVGEDRITAGAKWAREAELIARTVRLAVEVDGWQVRDGEGTRAARWSDVAILAPSVAAVLKELGPALEAHGIPYRTTAGTGLFLQPEIADLVNILHAVDDPTDEVHVVGALRSDAFGCSVDDLILYADVAGRFDPRRVVQEGPKSVIDGLTALGSWRTQRRGLSLPELVQRIVDGSGLVELALEQPGGAQAAGNVLRVVEEARTFASAGGGLRAFTRWLAERRDTDKESTEAVVTDPSDPVVRIMTIHGAKGLEFPIVVLAGLDSSGKNVAPDAIARPDAHSIELTVGDGFATPGYTTLATDEKRLLLLERDRLLYVAVTRAKDHLIIPAVRHRSHVEGPMARIMPSLPEITEDTVGQDVDGVHVLDPTMLPSLDDASDVEPDQHESDDEVTATAIADEEAWVAHRSEARERAGKGLIQTVASSVRPFDRIRPLAATATSAADAEAAADLEYAPPLSVGTALHRVMDAIALDGSQDAAPFVAAACLEAGIPHAVEEIAKLVDACLGSPVVKRAAASGSARREVPFTMALPDGVGFAVGRADLVFRDGDELVIVDYKTDSLPDNASGTLADAAYAHSGQGLVYAAAIAKATGLPVREVVFVFPRVRGEYVMVVDEAALLAAEGHLVSGASLG